MFFGNNFVQKEYFDCFDWKTEGIFFFEMLARRRTLGLFLAALPNFIKVS